MIEFTRKSLLEKTTTQSGEYDVIVAGGGPAAIGAAVGAAKTGAKTAIFESRSQFGGTLTTGLWMNINWLFLDNDRTDRGGAHHLIFEKLSKWKGKSYVPPHRQSTISGGNLNIHPEYLRLALFEIFEDLGIEYSLYSPVTGVLKRGSTVTGIEVTGKEGILTFGGKVVVDATGDGDVAWLAGCEMIEGREYDGRHMPMSLLFALSNVDEERLFHHLAETDCRLDTQDEKEKGEFVITGWHVFFKTNVPGMVAVNNGGCLDMNLDGAKTRDLTAMERLGNQIALDFVNFAREKKIPGLEECFLSRTAPFAAPRDTRRLIGEYVLTEEDVLNGTEFDDTVARKYGAIDAVGFISGPAFKQGAAYPFRSMLPKRVDNLLAAGRCGSADFIGHGAGKSMGNMIEVGQAAGVAAGIAALDGTRVRDVDVGKVTTFISEVLEVRAGKGNKAT